MSLQPITDLRLAAAQRHGAWRRALPAQRAEQACGGKPRHAERLFGWGREAGAVGVAARRTGGTGLGGPAAFRGRQRWEAPPPRAAAQAPQDPTFGPASASTRVTAHAASAALRAPGFAKTELPAPGTL
jgi:hypothetical protein